MRLDVLHRRKPPASPASLILRDAWKYGVGVGIAAVLFTAGGVDRVQPHGNGSILATNVPPTTVPCGPIATDSGDSHTATWTATSSPYGTGSPYNLPVSSTNNPDPTVPSCDAIIVPADVTLKIDPSQGDVQIFSHGAAIRVEGGHLVVPGTSATNSALFDAEPDVASWDGIVVTASDSTHRGSASLAYASIQHALTSITITSGATSTPDPTNLSSSLPYGLALVNSGVGPSYFDGIDATDTPVLVKGQSDPATHRADGKFGTVNNIGSQGIKMTFDASAPAVAAALDIESVTFGSSVPFAETGCPPLQVPCSAGSIGNDAILATFTSANPPPVLINQSRFYRAGSFGVELNGPSRPVITDNNFDCNGTGSAKPKETCVGTGLKYSAIYLNNATADLETSVTNNVGHEDGLDAIAFNGTVVYGANVSPRVLTWKNATNDASNDHLLGYLLNGDLNLNSGTLVVPGGSVVKSKGAINLTGAALDASAPEAKVFTSLRDNVNITSCPSVFVQSCPSPLPAGEWGGINLVGSRLDSTIRNATKGTITNSTILYATTGVRVSNGTSLTVTGSTIGPTFADGVFAEGTPLAVSGTTFGCPAGVCSGPSSGNHGILADFRNAGPLLGIGGLKVGGPNAADKNTFQGSVNEAIRGLGLTGQAVDVENNDVQNAGVIGTAGSAGIYLEGADKLTLKTNHVVGSGTGNLHYPAIQLDGVKNADFGGPISNNTGSGNGLDAIAFHGDSKALSWQTIGRSALLGYLVDGNLTVNGALNLADGDYAPVLGGSITVKGGGITTNGAVLTSLKEQAPHVPSCGSVFVPKASGVCPAATAGDWNGLVLDPGQLNSLTTSEIRYAKTGITMDKPTANPAPTNLWLDRTNIRNASADGLATRSPLSVSKGAFSNLAGRGIAVDLSAAGTGAALALDQVTIQGTGGDGVQAIGLTAQAVTITNLTVDHAGAFGLNLKDADQLTLTKNTVTNTAATFPAIYLNGFTGLFVNVKDNKGASNGMDAIAFHGTVTDDLTWQTARKTTDPTKLLGYLLDDTLTMRPGKTLTVNAGDIVKVGKAAGNGGLLDLQGVNLLADNTVSSSQKVFTSLSDNSTGVVACPSALLPGCTGTSIGDWGGINLSGGGANGALVNAAVRYASTGISINSGTPGTSGSSIFGLVVSGSSIGPSSGDGIKAVKTSVSLTNSTVSGGTHGVSVDDTGATASQALALRLSGDRFTSTSAEAILGQALSGIPAWITDNTVQAARTFGIRLSKSDALVLRNNNVSQSGGGSSAGASGYPAIYLDGVSADFARNVRGNVGSGNGLDVIAFHGTVNGDLSWKTPAVNASTLALGYVLDGSLTINDGTFTVHAGDVVKSLGGPITVKGGSLDASIETDTRPKIFTSLRDASAYSQTCPSILTGACTSGAQPGDWGGVVITNDISGNPGSGKIAYGDMRFASTALSIDSGPAASFGTTKVGLIVKATTISDVTSDGVNAQDTPISVTNQTTIQRAGVHGVVATFLGGTPCTGACGTSLDLETVTVSTTSKDGIVASGLGGRPTIVNSNIINGAGTYGIRLAGADQLTLNDNTVTGSGGSTTSFRYPAIYLGAVKADFELTAGTSTVARNHGSGNGLDAIVLHGEATQPLKWLTTGLLAPPALPLVPGDHFGYMLDGGLVIDGNLKTYPGDAVKVLTGTIKVNGAVLSTGTTFTSFRDGSVLVKACDSGFDSVFIQRTSGACPAPAAGEWGGINANAGSTLTNTTISFDDGLTVTGGALQFTGGGMHDIDKNAIVVNGSPLSVTNAVFTRIGNDAIDSTNSGSTDTITDDQFDHVLGVAINLQNAPGDLERNIFTNDANPAVKTSGAAVSLQCSSVLSGGVSGDSHLSISDSDLLAYQNSGQTVPDVTNTSVASLVATHNLWNTPASPPSTGPAALQTVGNVDSTAFLTSQKPVLVAPPAGQTAVVNNIGLTDANADSTLPLGIGAGAPPNVTATGAYGVSDLTVTVVFNRRMFDSPLKVWFNSTNTADPLDVSSHLVTGDWTDKANPHVWKGTYQLRSPAGIIPATATNGLNYMFVAQGKSCVPIGPNVMDTATGTFKVALTPSAVAVSVTPTTTPNYGSDVALNALVTSGASAIVDSTSPTAGQTAAIQFNIVTSAIQPSALVDAARLTGKATTNVSLKAPAINAGSYTVTAQFPGDDQYTPSVGSFAPLVINPAPTSLALVSTPTPGSSAASLDTLTLKATVTTDQSQILGGAGPNPGTADGIVTFALAGGGANPCASTAVSASASGLVVTCSTDFTTMAGQNVTATFLPSTPPTNFVTSNKTLTGTQTTLTTAADAGGLSETLTASVLPNPSADGKILFYDSSTSPVTLLCTVQLSSGSAACSTGTTFASLGQHNLRAIYAPDGSTYAASAGGATGTSTALTALASDSSGVTLTATVTPGAGVAHPNGTMSFTDGTGAAITCSSAGVLTPASGNTSTATCATTFGSTTGIGGKLALAAVFNGATGFSASRTSPDVTGTSISVVANPSPVPDGQSVTLTATVTHLSGSADPATGSVLFFDGATKLTSCSPSNGDGSVNLNGSGAHPNDAVCTLSGGLSPAGARTLTAIYNPPAGSSATFGSSLSAGQGLTVSQSTGTALTTAASTGGAVTLTATVTPGAGATHPAGMVAFTDGTGAAITCTGASVAPNQVTLSPGSGSTSTASCATDFSSSTGIGGKLALKAAYAPTDSTAFGASTSLNVPGTSTSLALINISPVSLTATVTHLSGAVDPTTGSVLFFDNGSVIPSCAGANLDGSVNLNGLGPHPNDAVCNLAAAIASGHSVTAVYNPLPPSAGSNAAFGSSLSNSVTAT